MSNKPPAAMKCKQINMTPPEASINQGSIINWIIWLFSSSIKDRVGHHLLLIFFTEEWAIIFCSSSSENGTVPCYLIYLCNACFFPRSLQTPTAARPTFPPLSFLIHVNTCRLSSEKATDLSSVGAEHIDLFSSIHVFHKSEDSFMFLSGWKKKKLH